MAVQNETGRVEAFSDGVFAIAITLLILEIRVPESAGHGTLGHALADLWPSYLAFVASFMTIGVMWLNHHRLFTLINKCDDGLIALNLLLLMGITWIPFPTGLLAEHLRRPDERVAGVVYAGSFVVIAIAFSVMWRYAVHAKAVDEHVNVPAITRQYALGPADVRGSGRNRLAERYGLSRRERAVRGVFRAASATMDAEPYPGGTELTQPVHPSPVQQRCI